MNKSLWKNKLNFVKDVPMVYVNFIITVILVSEKKQDTLLCTAPHIWSWAQNMKLFIMQFSAPSCYFKIS